MKIDPQLGPSLLGRLNRTVGHINLYYLQSHTVCELKTKFGDTDSVARMKQLVHIYFGHLFK